MSILQQLAEDFKQDVRKSIPWAQILNVPNLDSHLLKQINPPHGLFINENNVSLAGIETFPSEWKDHEHSFRGEELVSGRISSHIRFLVLSKTPVFIVSDGEILGHYYDLKKKGLSDEGIKAKENPSLYKKKAWYLIILLDERNNILGKGPVRLALSGATEASFRQEIRKDNEEIASAFFTELGLPKQSLNEDAHKFFVHDWILGPYRSGTNAPYEAPLEKLGPVKELKTALRYKNGDKSRNIEIHPESLENLMIPKRSDLGIQILGWTEEYATSLDFASKAIKAPVEPESLAEINEYAPAEEIDEDLPF